MSLEHAPDGRLPLLPSDTQVGDWRVLGYHGQGSYGVVYRAVRIGQEEAGPVALKVALYPWDPRYAREVELLARVHHPSIPRLLGRGLWRSEKGAEYPYLVMEWVDGTPLYEWARQQSPSAQEQRRVLAQLARALEATHAANALHRDIKGANVLVRHADGRAMLLDFGSGSFQGAERLTWQSLPPGTSDYRSPAANLYLLTSLRAPTEQFHATAADDLYALGVTAYRLVTGEYPPEAQPVKDETGAWRVECPDLGAALERKAAVEPRMRESILKLLAEAPEARGTAAEFAQTLEAPDAPVESRVASSLMTEQLSTMAGRPQKQDSGRGYRDTWRSLAIAVGVACLLTWTWQAVRVGLECTRLGSLSTQHADVPDAGSAAVGDSTELAPLDSAQEQKALADEMPPEPRPGQTRTDEKGKCPGRQHVPINGGCWVEQPLTHATECQENGFTLIKGQCYAPALLPHGKRPPTSFPRDAR